MEVKILTRLKNGSQIINPGTVFEGDEKTLPDFVLYELKRNRGTIEVLPEPKRVRKTKIKAPAKAEPNGKDPVKAESDGKASALRKKIADSEK